jgi:hypothetical protein
VPLWQRLTGDSALAASLFVLVGVGILGGMRNVQGSLRGEFLALFIAWLLALLALLWALLAAA